MVGSLYSTIIAFKLAQVEPPILVLATGSFNYSVSILLFDR